MFIKQIILRGVVPGTIFIEMTRLAQKKGKKRDHQANALIKVKTRYLIALTPFSTDWAIIKSFKTTF
jgi:hypothetical protein